jgi:hypothetical protein
MKKHNLVVTTTGPKAKAIERADSARLLETNDSALETRIERKILSDKLVAEMFERSRRQAI